MQACTHTTDCGAEADYLLVRGVSVALSGIRRRRIVVLEEVSISLVTRIELLINQLQL